MVDQKKAFKASIVSGLIVGAAEYFTLHATPLAVFNGSPVAAAVTTDFIWQHSLLVAVIVFVVAFVGMSYGERLL